MLYLKLAWRNIWRNKRRTLITMTSIILAVLFSAVMSSLQTGAYDQMINNTAGSFSGHIQIQAPGYFDEPTLDHSLSSDSTLFRKLKANTQLRAVIPRIESYALIGGDHKTKAGMVIGIDFEAERALSKPDQKIISGEYFTSNAEQNALISEGLANYLNVAIGDSIILISSGYHGVSAATILPIKGIMKFNIPELNDGIVYLPIKTAQDFYGAYNRFTSIALLVDSPKDISGIAENIRQDLSNDYRVYDWQTLMPDLVQAIQADRGGGYIIMLVLYFIVGFGILGTILMMVTERKYEFGVLLSIGTSRFKLAVMLIVEMFTITLVGAFMGILLSLPIIFYFNINPMPFPKEMAAALTKYGIEPFIQFSTDLEPLLMQAVIIFIISIIISVYPIVHMNGLKPVEAMRR